MTTMQRCTGCGSTLDASAPSCTYCGCAAGDGPPRPASVRRDVFASLRASPDFERAMTSPPRWRGPSARLLARGILAIVLMLVFLGFAGAAAIGAWPAAVVGVLGAVLLIRTAHVSFATRRRFRRASLERCPARVLGKRVEIVGRGRYRRTVYHVTLEREDGTREERIAEGKTYGLVCDGDAGVAHVRGDYVLDFVTLAG